MKKGMNTDNKTKLGSIFLYIVLLVAAFIVITTTLVVNRNEVKNTKAYPSHVKEEYMAGCVDGNMINIDYCECTFNYLESRMSFGEFVTMTMEFQETQVMNEDTTNAIEHCADFL